MEPKLPIHRIKTELDALLSKGVDIRAQYKRDNEDKDLAAWEREAEETIKKCFSDTATLFRLTPKIYLPLPKGFPTKNGYPDMSEIIQ